MNDQPQSQPDWWSDAQASPPLPTPKRSQKRLFIIALAVILVGIAAAAIAIITPGARRTECLTVQDYKILTGADLDDDLLSSTTNFYTYVVGFKPHSTSYGATTDNDTSGLQMLQRTAQLYRDRKTVSMYVTIHSNYFTKDATRLAQQRADIVRAELTRLGIPDSAIEIQEPSYTPPEDETPDDSAETLVSLASAQTCKENE